MTRMLITGSSGQVGSYLIKYFAKRYDVVGLSHRLGDIRDKDIVEEFVKDSDIIIHTAAQLNTHRSMKNPIFDAEVNIIGTLNLLELSRKNNISKFIYFSTSAVYGNYDYLPIDEKHPLNPISPYGMSKSAAERYCLLYNNLFDLPIVSIRPFNIYSTDEDLTRSYVSAVSIFANKIRTNNPIIIRGSGSQKRDFVHVEDVAEFVNILLNRNDVVGETYNLGSGKPIGILELAKLTLDVYGKDESNIIYEKGEEGKIEHSYANIEKSISIGYKPHIGIEKGINKIKNFYERGYNV